MAGFYEDNQTVNIGSHSYQLGVRRGVVVEALCYMPEGRGIDEVDFF
jgi:hypothetical protein